jgi:SAM-dependent methyltransferase
MATALLAALASAALASGVPANMPDIGYLPTPQSAVVQMLELAEVKPGDVVYDLGCGDGRIVITAARKYGARGVGVEIDPALVRKSRANVRRHRLGKRVVIKQADIFEIDFSDADVVAMYLLPELNTRLLPQLRKLKPGARIVSFSFDMPGAKPERVIEASAGGVRYKIYKWTTPLRGS